MQVRDIYEIAIDEGKLCHTGACKKVRTGASEGSNTDDHRMGIFELRLRGRIPERQTTLTGISRILWGIRHE